jgi:hypothetical protein
MMTRQQRNERHPWFALRIVGGLALAALIVVHAQGAREESSNPFPLRRLLLPAEKVPAQLKRLREGVLVQMPRKEFEALVRQAAKGKSGKQSPHLIEARYRARLGDSQALTGTAQWKVLHPGSSPALLWLQGEGQPFNLALDKPRYENRDALVAEFPDPRSAVPDTRSLALLVDRPGEHTVLLEWSARGEGWPEGLQVDLRLPSCPVAVLEIDLPADRTLTALDGTLVSGPHAAENRTRQLWKIACGGKNHLPLLVRRGGRAESVLFARQKTIQKLSADGLESLTSFNLEALYQEVREFTVECDSVLRPIEVHAPFLERWHVQGNRVLIRLERPVKDGVLELRCLAPLGARSTSNQDSTIPWTSPAVRLLGALSRGETLELLLHPEVRIASWQVGDFRLIETAPHVDPETKLRSVRMVLQGGSLATGSGGAWRRPSVLLQVGAVALRVQQQSLWLLGTDSMSFTTQIRYQCRQGMLFQLPLRLPAGGGWDVEAVEMNPPELLRGSGVRQGKDGPLLLVDLRRPLRAAGPGAEESQEATLTVRLRSARPQGGGFREGAGQEMPFPDVIPLRVSSREGGLAIDFDEQVHLARVRTTAVAGDPSRDGAGRLWPAAPSGSAPALSPHFYFPFKGEAVSGTLQLRPRASRFRARALVDAIVASGRAAVRTRLLLQGESGMPSQVDVYLSCVTPPLEWTVEPAAKPANNRLRRVERLYHREVAGALAELAAATPLQAAVLHVCRPPGSFWRLTFERPLAVRRGLTLRATRTLERAPGSEAASEPIWEVPLALVLGASRQESEVTLHLSGTDLVSVAGTGLREMPTSRRLTETSLDRSSGYRPSTAWRSFRFSDLTARLTLQARTLRTDRAAESSIDNARLTTVLTANGELRHHFRFRLLRWSQRTVPVRLPAGAHLLGAGVNGRWLEHLAGSDDESPQRSGPGERSELRAAERTTHGQTIDLPALRSADTGELAVSHFSLLYTTPAPSGSSGRLWTWLEAPAPVLPVPSTAFSRRWLLPPGILPLADRRVRRLPGGEELPGPLLTAQRPTDLFRIGPVVSLPGEASNRLRSGQQALADAAAGLRNDHPGIAVHFDSLIEEVAFGYLRQAHPLVLDRTALAYAKAGPDTLVKVEERGGSNGNEEGLGLPWESLGLLAVPAQAGVLLTSRHQAQRWGGTLPETVEAALADAVGRGRDPSGRFVTALEWLQPRTPSSESGETSLLFPAGEALDGWTAWDVGAGTQQEAQLVVVNRSLMAGLGLALALMLALVLFCSRHRSGGLRLRFLLAWLALSGVALAWLPAALRDLAWWPLLAGLTISLPWYVLYVGRLPPRRQAPSDSSSGGGGGRTGAVAGAGATAGLLLLLVGQSPGPAQPPPSREANTQNLLDPEPVYLVGQDRQTQTVLVTPRLVARLKALAQPAASPSVGAVLVSALYEGKLVNNAAQIDATFQVHALAEGPATLLLPLSGVQLVGDVLLDGARVYPVAQPAPRGGYSLRISGAGKHKVQLHFHVPIPAVDDTPCIRQVRFRVPRLVQNRLVFRVGPGVSSLQALVKHGGQNIIEEPGGGQRLEADLGAVASGVLLRWYHEGKRTPPRVEFEEAYLWDLRPDTLTLTALVKYTISNGAVRSLYLDLPPSLEVRSAQARRPFVRASGRPGRPEDSQTTPDTVRLSNWFTSGAPSSRVVQLDFPGLVSGVVEVTLELVPRTPWPGAVLLPLPSPHGQILPRAPSYLAYRAFGVQAARLNVLRLRGIRNDEFAPFWSAPSRPAAASLTYASVFHHQRQPPELRLQLRPQSAQPAAMQTVTLQVGQRMAEVSVRAALKVPGKDLSLVEWEIQSPRPVVVSQVSGAPVGRWCQTGSRLLVWLEKTTASAQIDITGWLPLVLPPPPMKNRKPNPSGAGGGANTPTAHLDLPCFRILQAKVQTRLILRTAPGLHLVPQTMTALTPEGQPSSGELRYTARQPQHGGRFAVRADPAPVATVRTEAGTSGKELTFTSTIDYRREGELRSVVLRLRDQVGDVTLVAPAGTVLQRREQVRRADGRRERTWTLDLAPRVRDRYQVVLRGRIPLEEAAEGVPLPEVVVVGATATHTVVVDATLTTEGATGLVPIAPTPRSPAGVQTWKVAAAEWGLRLVPRRLTPAAPVQVLLAEHRVQVADGHRWLHEAVLWLRHDAPAELRLSWPAPVEVVGVSIDSVRVSVLQPEQSQLWLPLSGAGRIRHVRFCWHKDAGREPLERPEMTLPELEGTEWGPTLWTVDVPPGWEVAANSAKGIMGADRRAVVELQRAAAQLAISRELVVRQQHQQRPDEQALLAAQRRFSRSCWLVRLALEGGADPLHPVTMGPTPMSVSEWLRQLRQQNQALAREHRFEEIRQQAEVHVHRIAAEPAAAMQLLPQQGTPMSFLAQDNQSAPAVRLVPAAQRQMRQALSFSGQWLIVLLVVWLVTLSGVLRALVRWLWPEQIFLLGVLGWQVAGPTLVVLFLLALGAAGRLVLLIRGARLLLPHPARQSPSSARG